MKVPTAFTFLAVATCGLALPAAAVVLDFEPGFTTNQTSFSADGINLALTGNLLVTNFDTFGSGSSDWFVDTGFGSSRTGNVGGLNCTTANMGFLLTSLDFWTSNNGGNSDASGLVTLSGIRADNGMTISSAISVTPTGFTGADWDTTNDLSAFNGVVLKSVSFSLGTGIDYVAIDRIGLTSAIPEPSTYALLLGAATLGLATLHRRFARR